MDGYRRRAEGSDLRILGCEAHHEAELAFQHVHVLANDSYRHRPTSDAFLQQGVLAAITLEIDTRNATRKRDFGEDEKKIVRL